ncbi:MAG: CPBP family intramembrane metalloprotease [Chloroflexi bacterium]|nr:CPBP family intramembrane metalloprotease [Chloroflexota bacterium]
MEAIITLILIAILLALTIAANIALRERERTLHYLVVVALGLLNAIIMIFGVLYIVIGISPDLAESMLETDIDPAYAFLGGVFFLITGLLASILLIDRVRVAMSGWFPRLRQPEQFVATPSRSPFEGLMMRADGSIIEMPPTLPEPPRRVVHRGELRGFDPHNTVHMLAMVLCVYLIGSQFANFAVSGGISGYADSAGVTWGDLILNFIPMIVIPIAGAGFLMRRSLGEVLERLGFHRLTLESIGVGIGVAIGAFVFAYIIGIIWFLLVPAELFKEQTEASQAISDSIDTIWLVLAVSFTSSVGEEIAFRGALQPIFGFWWTAILFTLVHIQYTLTPATIIIFAVALGLGWVRRRYNLYAAITAHFLYNFVQLILGLVFK